MIGLIDLDFCLSTSTTNLIPNIEIMKLASYYREENVFCRLIGLEEEDLSSYEKIYCFSETSKNIELPEAIKRATNITFGGSAFTGGKYVPFENSIIDFSLPRTFIYKEALMKKYNDGVKANVISHMLDNTYYRNYAGEEKLPLPAIHFRSRVILYDRDFFYPDWKETLRLISSHNPSSIVRLHPVVCNTLSNFFELRSFNKFSRANEIILDLDIPLKEVNYMLKKYHKQFLADIVTDSNVFIPFGGNQNFRGNYYKSLIYALNLLYSYWNRGIMIKLRYEEPSIGYTNPIHNLCKAAELWSRTTITSKKEKTLKERLTRKKTTPEQEEMKELIKRYPESKDLFEQKFSDLKARRLWRV